MPNEPKHDSDVLRKANVTEFLGAHTKPNGNGSWFKGFLRSNLFAALVLWLLAQVGFVVGMFWRVSSLTEWKGGVDSDIKVLKQQTADITYEVRHHGEDIAGLREADKEIKNDTKRLPVLEFGNARLTKDVEDLKNAAKK